MERESVGRSATKVFLARALVQARRKAGLIITHSGNILNYSHVDKAHVDCAGLLLNVGKEGFILSIHRNKGTTSGSPDEPRSSIGKLVPEQVEYLQSRGMEEGLYFLIDKEFQYQSTIN